MSKAGFAAALLAAATGVAAAPASAAGYFGLALGDNTTEDWDEVGFNLNDGSFVSADSDASDTGYRLFGGFTRDENLAFEFAYSDFGAATFDAQSSGCCFYPAGPVGVAVASKGIEAAVLWRGTVSESFVVLGRLGAMQWDVDVTVHIGSDAGRAGDSGTDILYGFGVEYAMSATVGVRGEITRYNLDDVDLDLFSLSMLIRP
jgi:OOP family OmpA-OmpF porin